MDTPKQEQLGLLTQPLEPVLSQRLALRLEHVGICLCFSMLFMYLNYVPLFHTETWRHVALGSWMIENRTIPDANPLLELSQGMSYVSTAWLSQLSFAAIERWAGAEGLSNCLALVQILTLGLLCVLFYTLSRSKLLSVLGVAFVVFAWWGQLGILRPQVFGGFCLVGLLWMLRVSAGFGSRKTGEATTDPSPVWWLLLGIPALMVIWTNLDGSFMVGLLLVLCFALGRLVEVWLQRRSLMGVATDRTVQWWVWLASLSLLATWVNPSGVAYWQQLISNGSPWLADAGGFRPLVLVSWHGAGFCVFWAVAMSVFAGSQLRISPSHAIVLAVASVLVAFNELFIYWFAPISVMILLPYAADILNRYRGNVREAMTSRSREDAKIGPASFAGSLICLLIIWIAFAFSPISTPLLGGTTRSPAKIYNSNTPLGVSEHFESKGSNGLVWAPQYWGDWLQWSSGEQINVFLNSDPQAIPRQVRRDYLVVFHGGEGWQQVLDRYNVRTLILDKKKQDKTFRSLLSNGKGWRVDFEDAQAIVLSRTQYQVQEHRCGNDS